MASASNIKMVKENLALSIALWAAAQRGVITAAYIPGKTEFKAITDETVEVSSSLQLRDNRELVRCISNQIRGSFAFSAIQTYRTLESTFKGSPLQEANPDLKAARCSFYLLNHTVSRDLMSPKWSCPPEYRDRFEIHQVPFTLDASALDGKEVFWDDFGGLQTYIALLQYCSEQVEMADSVGNADKDLSVEPEDSASTSTSTSTSTSKAPPGRKTKTINVADFITARCVVNEDALTIANALYQAYTDWCQDENQEPLPQRSFGMQLSAQGFQRRRRGKGRHWWTGVGLPDPDC